MASDKEQCFEDALDSYNDAMPDEKKLNIKHRQPWVQGQDGIWRQEPRGFWAGVNSMMKSVKFKLGLAPAPGSAQQVRVPDVTLDDHLVVDTKFTRGDGTIDDWGKKPGAGNGKTQREDYNDINKQTNPKAQDLKLDPKSCKCQEQGEPQPVEVPVMSPVPGMFFAPLPSQFPMGGSVPSTVPGGIPFRFPIPIMP